MKIDFSDNTNDLFDSIRDHDISTFSLERMRGLKLSIEENRGKEGDSSLSKLILSIREDLGIVPLMDLLHDHEVDYTLFAILVKESSWSPEFAHMNEVLEAITQYFSDSMSGDIFMSGASLIWRSMGIINEDMKKRMIKNLLENLNIYEEFNDPAEQHIDLMQVVVSLVQGRSLFEKTSPVYEQSKIEFLLGERADRREEARRFSLLFKRNEPTNPQEILFRWIMPLCHMAYINDIPSSTIISSANEIIEGLADAYNIESDERRKLFTRRCLAHVAMGFDGLMREMAITKEDIIPFTEDQTASFSNKRTKSIGISPASVFPEGDYLSAVFNDRELLLRHNVNLGVDEYMEIEKNKLFSDISLLGAHAQLDSSVLREAISHPDWLTVPSIILEPTSTVTYSPYSEFGRDMDFDMDLQIAMLRREAKGLTTHPLPSRRWTREEQRQIVSTLCEEGLFTASIYRLVKPDSDIVMDFRKKIPREVQRMVIETDLGM